MKKITCALINPFFAAILCAHPHVFIDYTVDFVFDQSGLVGIRTEWYFDEMYSSMLLQDYDVDNNGMFSPDEIVVTERDAFSNLENYNYFVDITMQSTCYKVEKVKDFSADVRDDRVVYTFFIPYMVQVTGSYQDVEVCMYDETYYVDLLPMGDDPVRFTHADSIDFTYKVYEDEKESRDYGQIYPYSIRLTFKRKQ
jgi:ABC-type uncharacterized transport system substrate-binding protein